jgi:hypothetical protein
MFKHEKDKDLFLGLHPILLMIFFDLRWYAKSHHGIDLIITATSSTKEEDEALGRTSLAHREKIALDIRSKNINTFITNDLINYINDKEEYEEYRYMSFSGISRLAYLHVGSAEHIHLALHSSFANF